MFSAFPKLPNIPNIPNLLNFSKFLTPPNYISAKKNAANGMYITVLPIDGTLS